MLKCVGVFISELYFDSSEASRLHRYFEIFGKHVGKNIRCASFAAEDLENRNFTAIKPILENLASLSINAYSKYFFSFELFQAMCPNLKKLKLKGYIEYVGCSQTWPKLESFSAGNIGSNVLGAFLRKNSKIATLKCSGDGEILQNVAACLPNVQKVTINDPQRDWFVFLVPLRNLTKLTICNVASYEVYDVLKCLKEFSTLR